MEYLDNLNKLEFNDLEINDYVVVDTEKGNQYARVINNDITNSFENIILLRIVSFWIHGI